MAAISLVGCGNSGEEKTKLKVGATAVPHAEILEQAKPLLKEKGIELDVVTFQDYVLPNTTLDEGELDANYFQHIPYLEDFCAQNGTKLVSAGAVHYEPMGIYTNQSKGYTIDTIPEGLVCCVFKRKDRKMSHTGMHMGGGEIVHCSTTVKRGRTDDSGWTHYAIPKGLYSDEELAALQEAQPIHPTLREGNMGESVRQMQVLLIAAGFPCGNAGADGIFGQATLAAVKSFQAAHGLTVDGIVGRATWAALDKVPDEKPDTWTVHIPGLDKATAEAFAAAYDGAYITQKGE